MKWIKKEPGVYQTECGRLEVRKTIEHSSRYKPKTYWTLILDGKQEMSYDHKKDAVSCGEHRLKERIQEDKEISQELADEYGI